MANHVLRLLVVLAVPQAVLALQVGDTPSAIRAKDQDGRTVDLGEMYGRRPVVLFFYPKSFTPGCTIEVQAFRDRQEEFKPYDAAVFGVSQDNQKTQRRFCDKYKLEYALLVDEGGKIAKAFGIPTTGKYNSRWTVVVGRDGKIVAVDSDVNKDIKGHPNRVAAELEKDWKQYVAGFKPLFNGKNTDGWLPINAAADTWTVKDRILHCSGRPICYIRTRKSFQNYTLLVEFQYTKKLGNAGLLVHITGPDKVWPKSIEPNLNVNQMGKFYLIGGAKVEFGGNNPLRKVDIPVGQWHRYEITCKGDTIEAVLNGEAVNRATKSNLTSGPIGVQSEGVPTCFRTIAIKPAE